MEERSRILIVDDEPLNIKSLSDILSQEYELLIEKDGIGCIESAKEFKPDLILLDIIMPAMNGFEVIRVLKSEEATKNIPVIFATGLDNAEDEEMGLSLGAADYVNKPFRQTVVKLRVKNQLELVKRLETIQELSMTDSMTGVGNRRFFNQHINLEWNRAIRSKKEMGLLLIDIDFFKNFNDTYGHLIGDMVLKHVADIICQYIRRPSDKCVRWGGEEFVAILPETNQDGALKVAEDIRTKIESTPFIIDENTSAKITISVGLSCTIPEHNSQYTTKHFIEDADKALYQAKETGRNKVVIYKVE